MEQFHVSPLLLLLSYHLLLCYPVSLYSGSSTLITIATTPNGFQPSNHQYPQASLSNS